MRDMHILATLVAILLIPVIGVHAFVVEPWYAQLNHFGPLASSNWAPRPMKLVADYTYRIENLEYNANMPFMFVSKVPVPTGGVSPPLGDLNWKQGKIGMRSTRHTQPGGSGGYVAATGVYNFTLHTAGHPTAPNTLVLEVANAHPSVWIESVRSVTDSPNVLLEIRFSEPINGFNATRIVASNAVLNASSVRFMGKQAADDSFLYTVECSILKEGVATFDLQPGAASSVALPRLPSSSAPTWSVLFTRRVGLKQSNFGRLFTLRDKSRPGFDAGGWYVATMHANFIPSLGQVLLSGFGRRSGETCSGGPAPGGRRGFGLSFLLDPSTLAAGPPHGGANDDETSSAAPLSPSSLVVQPIDEDAEFYIPTPVNGAAAQPTSGVYDDLPIDGDVIYCAGHTTMPDGKVFFAGGARYANLSSPYEHEWGLDYARLFDPRTRSFESVRSSVNNSLFRMPLGTAWYPTTGRLPDGRVLVTGGFTAYGTAQCVGEKCLNPQINIFDYPLFVRSGGAVDPWRVLVNKTYESHAIDPGVREYTRIMVLPEPVMCGGLLRQVLMMGKMGAVVLLSTDEATPMDRVLCLPPGGVRPSGCPSKGSEQSSAVPLMLRGGELLVMGGCDAAAQQRIDLYNVRADTWRSVDTGIRRQVPSSLLLPDGNVLLISGENPDVNQIRYRVRDGPSDPRYPQVFDPEALTVLTEMHAREDVFRGYHNFASLVGDGSVMLGSGYNQFGDVGCENPNVRLFSPSYLFRGPRPALAQSLTVGLQGQGQYLVVSPGQQELRLALDTTATAVPLHKTRGVALLAVQDFTHSYGENQRYIALPVKSVSTEAVVVSVPASPVVFDGLYQLFLLSELGVPSRGLPVRVCSGDSLSCGSAPPVSSTTDVSPTDANWGLGSPDAALAVAFCVLLAIILVMPAARYVALRQPASFSQLFSSPATKTPAAEDAAPRLRQLTAHATPGRSPMHSQLEPSEGIEMLS